MLIKRDYGCDLFKYLLEENGPFKYNPTKEHAEVFRMIINENLVIDPSDDLEYLFRELSYFGHNKFLEELYEHIYSMMHGYIQIQIEEHFNYDGGTYLSDDQFDYLKHAELSHEFLRTLAITAQDINIILIPLFSNPHVDEEFWDKYYNEIEDKSIFFMDVSENENVTESFYEKYFNDGNDHNICKYGKFSLQFLENNINKLNWIELCQNKNVSEKFFEKYIENVKWEEISSNPGISESFFERYIDNVNWKGLSSNTGISSKFYRKHIDKIDWTFICFNNLEDEFLEEFEEKLKWRRLSQNNTKASENFWFKYAEKYKNVIDWDALSCNTNITEKFLDHYIKYIKIQFLPKNPNVSQQFYQRHIADIKNIRYFLDNIKSPKYSDNDLLSPKNKYSVKYWLKHQSYYSFDNIWKKAKGII